MVALPPDEENEARNYFRPKIVTNKPASIKPISTPPPIAETEPQRFERVLSGAEFMPLKTIFDQLGADSTAMNTALITTNSYQMFLGKLGYRVVVVKQIHEQDCYSRLGPVGGIRAVIPLHDTATYSTLVTLVNHDASVTTTQKSVDYYDDQLAEFKTRLMHRSGNGWGSHKETGAQPPSTRG